MNQGKTINSITIKELFDESSSGLLPVMADIEHDHIVWNDNSAEQENGHLRLINDGAAVKYKGKKYMPSVFQFTMPTEDGKKIGNTTITVSAIDQRIIEIIRSINNNPPTLTITAVFGKRNVDGRVGYEFHELNEYKFTMNNCRWTETTAQWDLVFDTTMQINVPIDMGTKFRNPAINQGQ